MREVFGGRCWDYGEYLVTDQSEPDRPPFRPRMGWVGVDLPLWAMCANDKGGWDLTHLPTGRRAGTAKSPALAAEFAERMECLPFNWGADTVEVIGLVPDPLSRLSPDEQDFYHESVRLISLATSSGEVEEARKKPGPRALRTPRRAAGSSPAEPDPR